MDLEFAVFVSILTLPLAQMTLEQHCTFFIFSLPNCSLAPVWEVTSKVSKCVAGCVTCSPSARHTKTTSTRESHILKDFFRAWFSPNFTVVSVYLTGWMKGRHVAEPQLFQEMRLILFMSDSQISTGVSESSACSLWTTWSRYGESFITVQSIFWSELVFVLRSRAAPRIDFPWLCVDVCFGSLVFSPITVVAGLPMVSCYRTDAVFYNLTIDSLTCKAVGAASEP